MTTNSSSYSINISIVCVQIFQALSAAARLGRCLGASVAETVLAVVSVPSGSGVGSEIDLSWGISKGYNWWMGLLRSVCCRSRVATLTKALFGRPSFPEYTSWSRPNFQGPFGRAIMDDDNVFFVQHTGHKSVLLSCTVMTLPQFTQVLISPKMTRGTGEVLQPLGQLASVDLVLWITCIPQMIWQVEQSSPHNQVRGS